MGPTQILEMARTYGLRPQLWLLIGDISIITQVIIEILALSSAENGVIFRFI